MADWAYRTPSFPEGISRTQLRSASDDDQLATATYWFRSNFRPYELPRGKYFSFGPGGPGFGAGAFAPSPIYAAQVIDEEFGDTIRDTVRKELTEKFFGRWMWVDSTDDVLEPDELAMMREFLDKEGGESFSQPPSDLTDLPTEEAVQEITRWFFENFEDPAQNTPYESAEGGYQWIWGGPYDAREVIQDNFSETAPEDVLEAAIEVIQRYGDEWAPNLNRISAEAEAELEERISPERLHKEMLERIGEVERALERYERSRAKIGHNNPPEKLEPEILSDEERERLTASLSVLKSKPVQLPESELAEVETAAKEIESLWRRLLGYTAKQADIFVSAFVKASGTATAGAVAYKLLADKLGELSHAITNWLSVIHQIF
ncbi:MAG: hypothetical protein ACTHPD_17575 [Rhizomicrobium sp.]